MGTLRIGIVDQSPVPTGGTGADALRDTLALAREAERLGYHRYWLAEHHSTNSFAGSAPEVLIAAVAAETRAMRVGSGGVLLTHYSPLKVAEQFRTLATLYPGRIDLGIGRAPGTHPIAVQALQYGRGAIPIQRFGEQLDDLVAFLENERAAPHPWRKVRAMPRGEEMPELWLLGSGGESAQLAAERGHGFAYAQFISGEDGAEVARAYRAAFRPSPRSEAPRVIVALGVVCAETDEEALRLASGMAAWRNRIARGVDRGIPSPEVALEELAPLGIPAGIGRDGARSLAGTPERLAAEIRRVAARYEADEVMLVTVVHDPDARLRSFRLLADVLL